MITSSALHSEILACARTKSAMQMKSSATLQMKLNPPFRRRGGFHPRRRFHRRRRFIPPDRVDLAEKARRSVLFLVPVTGLEPVRVLPQGILSPWCLPIPPQRHMEMLPHFFSTVKRYMLTKFVLCDMIRLAEDSAPNFR